MEQPLSNTISEPLSNTISEPLSNTISDPLSEPLSNTISEPLSEPVSECQLLPRSHSIFICGLSTCSLFAGLYGFQRNIQIIYCPLGVFLSSVNYWRNPTRGIRRNIDIMAVGFGIVSHLYSSTKTNQLRMYGTSMGVCFGLYGLSWCLYKKGYLWASAISHGSIHIIANIANAILYNGLSKLVL